MTAIRDAREVVQPNQTKQQSTSDWAPSACWIWTPKFQDEGAVTPGKYVLFRKTFSLPQGDRPDQFIIHISADSRYRLFINEQSVSFGPCKSYPERWYFETVDIASFLIEGTNVVSARVLRYAPDYPGSSSIVRTVFPGFMVHGSDDVRSNSLNWRSSLNSVELCHLHRRDMEMSRRYFYANCALFSVELSSRTSIHGQQRDNPRRTYPTRLEKCKV
jgi:hypothetical protein